jgi:hypothetical protein
MNPPRATADDYIQFLLGTPKVASAAEAARVQPAAADAPAHDAFSRLLARLEPDPATLWAEVRPLVRATVESLLVVDDTVLDKPYARKMGLVGPHWSGKHKRVVRGINLVTLAWTDGDAVYPTDYRLVDPAAAEKKTKNDLFREMITAAKDRGLAPISVNLSSYCRGIAWYVMAHEWTHRVGRSRRLASRVSVSAIGLGRSRSYSRRDSANPSDSQR